MQKSDITEAIARHCKKRKCHTFIPGEIETLSVEGKDDIVRLGPCTKCRQWNILDGNGKTMSVTEEYFEAVQVGTLKLIELDNIRQGLPATKEGRRQYIKDNLTQGAKCFIEAGRALIIEQEECGHGEFLSFLDEIGISKTNAYRWMTYARASFKFPAAGNLGPMKVEVLTSCGADWKEAEETGKVLEKPIDEWEAMSVNELRKELRKHSARIKHGAELQDKLLADKEALEEQVLKLKRQLAVPAVDPDQEVAHSLDRIAIIFDQFVKQLSETDWKACADWTQTKMRRLMNDMSWKLITLNKEFQDKYSFYNVDEN